MLERADEVDNEEDRRYGSARRGDERPDELARRESRLAKIREAKAALESDAQQLVPAIDAIEQVLGGKPEQLLRRGITKVSQDWAMVCTAHNMLKLYGAWARP